MATVNFKAHKHHLKSDGTINVKLVVYHNGKRAYPDTDHYVSKKQLTKNYEFKDPTLIAMLTTELGHYRKLISEIGREKLSGMSAASLAIYLMPEKDSMISEGGIDIIAFGRSLIDVYKGNGQDSIAGSIRQLVNNLTDFKNTEVIYTSEITPAFIKDFAKYMQSVHQQVRANGARKDSSVTRLGVKDSTLITLLNIFKLVFNAARERFNDEDNDLIRIKNMPFKKIKVGTVAPSKNRSLSVDVIADMLSCQLRAGSVAEMTRDLNMISFYLCGMNAKDIYNLSPSSIKKDRIDYNRSKTKNKRADSAFISIKITIQARPLLNKWIGKLREKYSSYYSLITLLSNGNRSIAKSMAKQYPDKYPEGLTLHFYAFRHTFASEARNTLKYSISDVGEALNHGAKSITDTYIKKDWSLIDKIQAEVTALIPAPSETSQSALEKTPDFSA